MKKCKEILIGVLLLSMVFFTACTSKAAKAMEKVELGQKYLTELNYTEAVASFTEAIGLDPENISAYMGRAEAYVGLKQYDDAKTDYTTAIEKAVEQPYTRAEAYVGRAEVNEVTNANEAALSDYESAQNILDSIDWSKFKEITEQMLKALQEKIEKACEELRALLGLNENDEPLDTTAIFQNAIDGVAADAEYAENERYVIVNDYDGDGKQEAFGFLGIRNDEYQTWESVKLYYLKSDGSVEKIALNGDVTGGPAKVSGTEQMDFSESFITLGNKTFLDFEIGYSASEPTTVLFGVNDGNYNVADNICASIGTERIVRQTDGTQQIGTFCHVLAGGAVLAVHGVAAGNKGNNAARSHLVDGFRKEIIVDAKTKFVVRLVVDLVLTKWHVTHRQIVEITTVGGLKARHGNVSLRIQFFRNTPGDAVQLHAV